MRNLIAFFVRYHAFLLFIILQVISFNLIVSYNKNQRSAYLSSASSFGGFLLKKKQKIKDYFDLKDQNGILLAENKRIREQLFDLTILNKSKLENIAINDTVDTQQRYVLIPSRVINNSTALANNFITIDGGKEKGVLKGAGVIGDQGVVGVVNKVTNDFSTIISILNGEFKISATIEENGFFGNLEWDVKSPNHMVLSAVAKHAHIEKGYRVVTNGFSSKFPEGIFIGTIDEFSVEDGSNFYNIKIKLTNEMGNLKHVYVVDDLMKNQIDSLSYE